MKSLEYYLSLNYTMEVNKIPENEGGGYIATIPALGKRAFIGDGDSVEEAIRNLETVKKILFTEYLEKGISIPEPENLEMEKEYSGRFVLRIPGELHKELTLRAKENKITLNQYCLYLLTQNNTAESLRAEIKELLAEVKNAEPEALTTYSVVSEKTGKKITNRPE